MESWPQKVPPINTSQHIPPTTMKTKATTFLGGFAILACAFPAVHPAVVNIWTDVGDCCCDAEGMRVRGAR